MLHFKIAIGVFLSCCALILTYGVIDTINDQSEVATNFDNWVNECGSRGGFAALTAPNWYECFVNGEIVKIPGY